MKRQAEKKDNSNDNLGEENSSSASSKWMNRKLRSKRRTNFLATITGSSFISNVHCSCRITEAERAEDELVAFYVLMHFQDPQSMNLENDLTKKPNSDDLRSESHKPSSTLPQTLIFKGFKYYT